MIATYTLVALVAISMTFVAYTDINKQNALNLVFKAMASILVVSIGLVSITNGMFSTWQILIIAGLSFSLVGDVFLTVNLKDEKDKKLFYSFGCIAYCASKIFYILSFLVLAPNFNLWLIVLAIAFPVLLCIAQILKVLEMSLATKITTILYAGALGTMLATAVNVVLAYGTTTFALFVVIGAVLMSLSDITFALSTCTKKMKSKFMVIPVVAFYYTAQVLIALSIGLF